MKVLSTLVLFFLVSPAYGFEKESSFKALNAALSVSNKEYNEKMREKYQLEHEKMNEWNQRDVSSVSVQSGIKVEKENVEWSADKNKEETNQKVISAVLHKDSINE